jgi:DNA replication and repair protein RecF
MRILSLSIEQFRNFSLCTLDLSEGNVHLFIGPNAAGKTNILEAIALLSLTKSCFPHEEGDLRQWETAFYRVVARVCSDQGEERELEIVSQSEPRREKACFINGVRIPVSEMVGALPSVLFLPQDLGLFVGPPSERRWFLDQILCQVSPEYGPILTEYQRLLKQRNAALQRIAHGEGGGEELIPWDEELSKRGSHITIARLELLSTFGVTLAEELRALGGCWEEACIQYERTSTEREPDALCRELRGLLERHRDRDLLLQSTTIGPHRDDWQLLVDGRAIASFASRGEQRLAILALLFLEVSYVELRRNERPIVLLDDVFSELDDVHQAVLLGSLAEHQVLITAVRVPEDLRQARLWYLESGTLRPHGGSVVPA